MRCLFCRTCLVTLKPQGKSSTTNVKDMHHVSHQQPFCSPSHRCLRSDCWIVDCLLCTDHDEQHVDHIDNGTNKQRCTSPSFHLCLLQWWRTSHPVIQLTHKGGANAVALPLTLWVPSNSNAVTRTLSTSSRMRNSPSNSWMRFRRSWKSSAWAPNFGATRSRSSARQTLRAIASSLNFPSIRNMTH